MNTAFIDPTKTALVVIDLQKGIMGLPVAPYTSAQVLKNAVALADDARKQGMPVFLVRVTPSADGKDALKPVGATSMSRAGAPAADWAEIMPEIGPKETDFVITKRQWGAFTGTELDLQMRRRGITAIILCGIATNIGVESTARFAFEYGYNQIFVEDAMASFSADDHAFAVNKIFTRLGLVKTTQEILGA